MKCERCGQREATFYYQSNINGKVTQVHLCPECAAELGYTRGMSSSFRSFRRSFFEERQRNALENQLKAAVDDENYEEAARLRDELKKLSA